MAKLYRFEVRCHTNFKVGWTRRRMRWRHRDGGGATGACAAVGKAMICGGGFGFSCTGDSLVMGGAIRQEKLESPWAGLVGGVVLADAEFARRVLGGCKVNEEEQTEARRMRRRVSWEEVVQAAEKIRHSRWEDWADRHGDWGRDGAMHVAVRYGGLRLTEVMRAVDGLRYQAAAQAVKRFRATLGQNSARRKFVSQLRRHLSLI